jgi:hypothetical protein
VKKTHNTQEYLLLAFPENTLLFGVARLAEGSEKFLAKDPDGKEHGAVYDSILHVVSPFINPLTNQPGEWCSCLQWKTRKNRCVHLKKFFELNPHPQKPAEPINPLSSETLKTLISPP